MDMTKMTNTKHILMAIYGNLIRVAHGTGLIRMTIPSWTRMVKLFGILLALCDEPLIRTSEKETGWMLLLNDGSV